MNATCRLSWNEPGALALALLMGCGGGESAPPASPTPTASASPVASATPRSAPPPKADVASTPNTGEVSAPGAWPFGAAPSDAEKSAQADRLRKDPGPIKSNWTPPTKGDRYGHAEGLINAPAEVVRGKLGDFAHFKDLAGPKFKSVKVVEKQGTNTDVYFQLPIMKGMITIWYITRFAPPRAGAGGDVIEGTYVKGNIKGMHIAFNVRAADDKSSVVVCDLVLQPNVPAPQSALDEELRDACGDAINALRKNVAGGS